MDAIHDPIEPTSSLARTKDVEQGVGAMLRERRIALGLSQADIANVVKLPARRIEAMEKERWDELPDGPYLRGFLKNIARALDLDAATLIDRVDESLMRSRNPDSILVAPGSTHATLPRRSGPAEGRHSGRALVAGALVFALIAALIAWSGTESFDRAIAAGKGWLAARDGHVASSTPAPDAASAKTAVPQMTSEPIEMPQTGATMASSSSPRSDALPQSATAPAANAAPATNSASAASSGSAAMQFHFSEDAWVEVRSADGKVLLSRLNAAGSDQAIEGEAPFSVVVGNAKGVSLNYRGQPVDLGPYTRDQVARFTLS